MCQWGNDVMRWVPIPAHLARNQKFHWEQKAIDSCIVSLVDALNRAGHYTAGCCCGHHRTNGNIVLHNGHILIIPKSVVKLLNR